MSATSDSSKAFVPPFVQKYFSKENIEKYPELKQAIQKVLDTEGEDDTVWEDFTAHYNKFRNFEWCGNSDGTKYDIVFYGVSGYTGYLMMEYLKRVALKRIGNGQEEFTFALAGRTARKVRDLRDREFAGTQWADTPVLAASFDDIFSIIDLVKSARVIINVAGPYMLTQGDVLIDACIQLGTHYIDISGEIPWTLRLADLHESALKNGVCVIPSAASAGALPDLCTYLCAKKLKDDYGEETRYVACYRNGGGAKQSASGGTLKTRAAMSEMSDDMRRKMGDPFSLGGFIPDVDRWGIKNINVEFGTGKVTAKNRQEDLDVNFAKVSEDKKLGVWRGPMVYSYFDTRVVRQSNAQLADLGNCPYGRRLNFMEYQLLPPEAALGSMGAKGKSVAEEKAAMEAAGTYYKEGEGPPLEDLEDAWISYFLWAQSEGGHEVKLALLGRDGYFETARVAIETAMCLRFDGDKLQFKGGVLNAAVACGTCLATRLVATGMRLKTGAWLDEAECVPPPFLNFSR